MHHLAVRPARIDPRWQDIASAKTSQAAAAGRRVLAMIALAGVAGFAVSRRISQTA
jgi:hypothetical protein